MNFDTIKLDKGLYTASEGFNRALENIDPSENYKGTQLENLDAFQRQLKRFDIKVSGRNSDTIEKFFKTSDSAALFPEYISRAVAQGIEGEDLVSKIVATTTEIVDITILGISLEKVNTAGFIGRVFSKNLAFPSILYTLAYSLLNDSTDKNNTSMLNALVIIVPSLLMFIAPYNLFNKNIKIAGKNN